jgi:uncharacterized protein (TIGR02001 family)
MRSSLLALGLLSLSGAAMAQDFTTYVGAAVTTDYISDGETQSGGDPALQGYVEAEHASGLYLGAWASTVDLDGDSVELDLYLGFRNEIGPVSYDIGYFRYLYDESGDCCGELILALGYAVNDTVGLGLELTSDLEGTESVRPEVVLALPGDFELSGGVEFFSDDGGEAWDVGVSRPLTDTIGVDLRYHDASYVDEGTLVLTLSWDTDFAALTGR